MEQNRDFIKRSNIYDQIIFRKASIQFNEGKSLFNKCAKATGYPY